MFTEKQRSTRINARIQKSGSPVTVLVASLFVHRLNDIVYAFSSTMKG